MKKWIWKLVVKYFYNELKDVAKVSFMIGFNKGIEAKRSSRSNEPVKRRRFSKEEIDSVFGCIDLG